MPRTALPTDIAVDDPNHDDLHNETNERVNLVEAALNLRGLIPEDYGIVGNGLADNSTKWPLILADADSLNLPIFLPKNGRYLIDGLSSLNQRIHIYGPGELVGRANSNSKAVFEHTLDELVPVTATAIKIAGQASPNDRETMSQISVDPESLELFKAGDCWRIDSGDKYSYDTTQNIWKAENVPIMGVGFPLGAGSTIREADVVVGVISGATGSVGSLDKAGMMVLKSMTGSFAATENLTVGGVVKGQLDGAGFVLTRRPLRDSYVTTPRLRRFKRDKKIQLDININVIGDPETVVGYSARAQGLIELWGISKANVKFKARNSWATMIYVVSCYMLKGYLDAEQGPNNAVTTTGAVNEGGYGYGWEVTGTTSHSSFDGIGRYLRHFFTTNPKASTLRPTAGSSSSTQRSELGSGAVRDCRITGQAWFCYAAGFDNHIGAFDLLYVDCYVESSAAAGRVFSGMTNYQNRSANTTYLRCVSKGASNSLGLLGQNKVFSGIVDYTTVVDCNFSDFIYAGILMEEAAESKAHRLVTKRNYVKGSPMSSSESSYSSVPFKIAGIDWDSDGDTAARFIAAPVELTKVVSANLRPRVLIRHMTVDQSETRTGAYSGIRMSGDQDIAVHDITFISSRDTPWSSNRAAVRSVGASDGTITFYGDVIEVFASTAFPKTLLSVGTPTVIG